MSVSSSRFGEFFALSFISTTYILWILMSGVLIKFKSSWMLWSCLSPPNLFRYSSVASPHPCPASFTSFLFLAPVYGECFPLQCLILFYSFSFSFHISNFFSKKISISLLNFSFVLLTIFQIADFLIHFVGFSPLLTFYSRAKLHSLLWLHFLWDHRLLLLINHSLFTVWLSLSQVVKAQIKPQDCGIFKS